MPATSTPPKFTLKKSQPPKHVGMLVRFATEAGTPKLSPDSKHATLADAIKSARFKGKVGETLIAYGRKGEDADVYLVVGLGKPPDLKMRDVVRCGGVIAQVANKHRAGAVDVVTPAVTNKAVSATGGTSALAEGIAIGAYKYSMKSEGDNNTSTLKTVNLYVDTDSKAHKEAIARAAAIADGVYLARDLINGPSNVVDPDEMLATAKRIAGSGQKAALGLTYFDKKKLEAMKAGGILGVNRGSAKGCYLIALEHKHKPSSPTLCFVGKGITFDTGGISIKPSAGMGDMKMDMGGAGAVLGLMKVVALLKPKINVIGVIATTENMPDGNAYKPGDVLTMLSGKTVEVDNTDAEGRLILADSLTWACRNVKPDAIIDYATLTGACVIALGNKCAGAMTDDDKLAREIVHAGEDTGERVWRLPHWPEYTEQIKSSIADIKNTGGRGAGAITAGRFLAEFIVPYGGSGKNKDAMPLHAHVDIAGVAWDEKGMPHVPGGASGFGVRLGYAVIERYI